MTLQNLKKILDRYEEQLGVTPQANQLELLKCLPFYDWPVISHSVANQITTFNTVIGLPQKNIQSYPLFDYEKLLFDACKKI